MTICNFKRENRTAKPHTFSNTHIELTNERSLDHPLTIGYSTKTGNTGIWTSRRSTAKPTTKKISQQIVEFRDKRGGIIIVFTIHWMHQWPQGVSDVGLGDISYNGEDQWKIPGGSWVGYHEVD